MTNKKIEELLELSPETIQERKEALRRTLRTIPGIESLRVKAKRFEVQPWPFISYIAHYFPDKFNHLLDRYQMYDGAENSQNVLEGLREEYIIYSLMRDLDNKEKSIDVKFEVIDS